MGELKPIGSEKLSGDAKMKRILELTYYQPTDSNTKSSEVVKESKTGVYGIVKEKDGYYVKKGINETSLDYIGGLFMKNKNRYSAYGEALKKLEFLVEQESLMEATKYVLKQNKSVAPPTAPPAPQEEAPAPMATTDTAPPPAAGVPTDMAAPADGSVPPAPEAGDDEGAPDDPNNYLKVIQKMTGRLTQKLSTYQDKLESKDIKYVLNMVLAAIDLDKMDESDKDEILSKLEDDEEGVEPTSDSPTDKNGESAVPQESEMNEVDGISSLEELINTPLDEFENDDFGSDDEDNIDDTDIAFLNDPEIKKTSKLAKKDIDKEISHDDDDDDDMDLDNPLNSKDEFPIYKGEDKELEEDPMSSTGQMPSLTGNEDTIVDTRVDTGDVSEQDPNDPTSGPEGPAENEVKELDIDELTNMVNSSVKETLSKYFN
jgi:hypothetical protein